MGDVLIDHGGERGWDGHWMPYLGAAPRKKEGNVTVNSPSEIRRLRILRDTPTYPPPSPVWRVERVIILFGYFNCNSIIYIFVFISFVTFFLF